jgi:hypothetical protein
MEDGFKNLLCEDYPELSQPSLDAIEMTELTKDQIFASMKRSRRERKDLLRREEMERRITAGWDKDTNPVSILSRGEPSTISTDDPELALSTWKQPNLEKRIRYPGSRKGERMPFPSAGTSPDVSQGPGVKVDDQGVPVLSSFTSCEGEPEGVIVKVETQDEPQFFARDEMEVEISERIAKLKM